MKSSVIICAVLGLLCSAVPNYGRILESNDVTWTMMADGEGKLHLAILSGPDLRQDKAADLRENVTFMLYTRRNEEDGVRIFVDEADSLTDSGFDPQNPTKILIHGFTGNLGNNIIQDIKKAYLELGMYNIIGVGWGPLCPPPFYNIAKENALLVGEYVAKLVDFLVRETGAQSSDFHLIGHSLGGQVVGMVGHHVKSGKISRMTGLDPALPLFGDELDMNRLDPSDAVLVDVIHSDGGALGFWEPIGHIDFYPNGGKAPQPGCGADTVGKCSHGKPIIWFADSVLNRTGYPAELCGTVEEAEAEQCTSGAQGFMGDNIGSTQPGIYYLSILPEEK